MGAVGATKVRRGDIRHAIVVRTHKKVQRKDGMAVRFDDNACALIGKNGEPIGTRINGEAPLHGLRTLLRDAWTWISVNDGSWANTENRRCGLGTSR